MPKRWRFIGFVDGEVVTDQTGLDSPIRCQSTCSRVEDGWTIDWFEALMAGMAIELDLRWADHLDELLVIGVRDEPAVEGRPVLHDLLRDHAFSAGLGMLTPGHRPIIPPSTKSGWSSGPSFPPPATTPAG